MARLVEQKSAINLYFDENESEVENLTNQDYKLMVDLLKLLEPLEIATKELSGDKYSSLSLVIPILTQLHVEIAGLVNLVNWRSPTHVNIVISTKNVI